jgi:S1-C subfamily serine protease
MHCLLLALLLSASLGLNAANEAPDLRALAKQTRPAVYLLVLQDEDGKTIGAGTGFLVSSDGLLVTNQHVVAEAHTIIAKAENGGLFPVTRIIATDPRNDLALIQFDAKDLPFLTLAPDGSAEAGTRIAIIGSPLGLEGTLTEGIVSARRRLPKEKRDVLQISAPISQGSSGSPVLDSQGRVIGVASFLLQDGQLRKLLGKRTLKTTPPPSLQKNPPATYTVKQGDTLIQISRELEKQGVSATAEQIRTLNQIPKSSVIRPGQVLRIPQSQP